MPVFSARRHAALLVRAVETQLLCPSSPPRHQLPMRSLRRVPSNDGSRRGAPAPSAFATPTARLAPASGGCRRRRSAPGCCCTRPRAPPCAFARVDARSTTRASLRRAAAREAVDADRPAPTERSPAGRSVHRSTMSRRCSTQSRTASSISGRRTCRCRWMRIGRCPTSRGGWGSRSLPFAIRCPTPATRPRSPEKPGCRPARCARSRSIELSFRQLTLHAPAFLVFSHGRFAGLAVPGYREAAGFEAVIAGAARIDAVDRADVAGFSHRKGALMSSVPTRRSIVVASLSLRVVWRRSCCSRRRAGERAGLLRRADRRAPRSR